MSDSVLSAELKPESRIVFGMTQNYDKRTSVLRKLFETGFNEGRSNAASLTIRCDRHWGQALTVNLAVESANGNWREQYVSDDVIALRGDK